MITSIVSIWKFELIDLNGIYARAKWDLGYDVEVSLLECTTQSRTQCLYRCYTRKIEQYLRIFEQTRLT